jgi:hypothetical protein
MKGAIQYLESWIDYISKNYKKVDEYRKINNIKVVKPSEIEQRDREKLYKYTLVLKDIREYKHCTCSIIRKFFTLISTANLIDAYDVYLVLFHCNKCNGWVYAGTEKMPDHLIGKPTFISYNKPDDYND